MNLYSVPLNCTDNLMLYLFTVDFKIALAEYMNIKIGKSVHLSGTSIKIFSNVISIND